MHFFPNLRNWHIWVWIHVCVCFHVWLTFRTYTHTHAHAHTRARTGTLGSGFCPFQQQMPKTFPQQETVFLFVFFRCGLVWNCILFFFLFSFFCIASLCTYAPQRKNLQNFWALNKPKLAETTFVLCEANQLCQNVLLWEYFTIFLTRVISEISLDIWPDTFREYLEDQESRVHSSITIRNIYLSGFLCVSAQCLFALAADCRKSRLFLNNSFSWPRRRFLGCAAESWTVLNELTCCHWWKSCRCQCHCRHRRPPPPQT